MPRAEYLTAYPFPSQSVQLDKDHARLVRQGSRAYGTFQEAYNAADELQRVHLGGANIVLLMVGIGTAIEFGDCITGADWNPYVHIWGFDLSASRLGTIIAGSSTGDGYRVGLHIGNVSLAGISTESTTARGGDVEVTIVDQADLGTIVTSGATGDGTVTIHQTERIINEIPGGAIDGYNRDFTTLYTFVPSTLSVRLNGLGQSPGPTNDYEETSGNAFRFVFPPKSTDTIRVDYAKM